MKKTQLAKLGLTLGLVAAVGVGGTMALLSAKTDIVTNTFTVGNNLENSDLKLDEWPLQKDNKTANTAAGARVTGLDFEDLMPLDIRDKDPMVQIKTDAADCYVFVNVTGLDELKALDVTVDWNDSWRKLDGNNDIKNGVYYYAKEATEPGEKVNVVKPKELPDNGAGILKADGFGELPALFTQVTVGKNSTICNSEGAKFKIKAIACAIQEANIDSVDEAKKHFPTGFVDAFKVQ